MSEKRGRGRPTGYKMSQESKDRIAASKTGYEHVEATKDKISAGLTIYFKKHRKIEESILEDLPAWKITSTEELEEAVEWLKDHASEINADPYILSASELRTRMWRERLPHGDYNVEKDLSHELTPLVLVLLRESLREEKKNGII